MSDFSALDEPGGVRPGPRRFSPGFGVFDRQNVTEALSAASELPHVGLVEALITRRESGWARG
jgi:hypothetical protein